ncbi:hypothetical protein SAMN05216374_1070 [Tardiphaga sp. OK246]|jgi:hypothetical protein|uniref:hypothetical protein n=1 Tax=Tardiphaga sp. OK246 TaxID=1855307 RepID=UPI000B685163|nr:hypothetical protein [Tardiphaga sp. OK246]SNS38283.1 hypothetical protein SAMN05216374_1070 [Tardiphaga sp. OK246]
MPDESNKQVVRPAPPELFTIPAALIEQWGDIPTDARLNFPLTRQEIDHLLLGLLRSLEAQASLESIVVDWSNGRVDAANDTLTEFRRQNADAQNNVRQLAAAIMASAIRERGHAR